MTRIVLVRTVSKKKRRKESAPSAQSISEESITCVAVKGDRHQNIMSSVALWSTMSCRHIPVFDSVAPLLIT